MFLERNQVFFTFILRKKKHGALVNFFCPFWASNSYLNFNQICRNSTLFRSQNNKIWHKMRSISLYWAPFKYQKRKNINYVEKLDESLDHHCIFFTTYHYENFIEFLTGPNTQCFQSIYRLLIPKAFLKCFCDWVISRFKRMLFDSSWITSLYLPKFFIICLDKMTLRESDY